MSWNPELDIDFPTGNQVDQIETLIVPTAHDLGGFEVMRALPSAKRKMVGPFVFFDHLGPAEFIKGTGVDVRPHPHIGLSTVTYLYQGSMWHKDSLGTSALVAAGEVNLMTAGSGITHSERTAPDVREKTHSLFGIQTWLALPENKEEIAPTFENQNEQALPVIEGEGKKVKLILGSLYGERSPVKVHSEMFYADAALTAGAKIPLRPDHEERGLYVVQGEIIISGQSFKQGHMMTFRIGDEITIEAKTDTRLMLLGGTSLGKRYVWWNFVASSREKIESAKQAWREGDWQHGRFQLPLDDNQEFIPLP
ncbi:pirin family protein [Kiloniella antarctica]|uniref:Pirin family protein n=1 Tax=Kiloniella antarctica TaxID=1550907 RepID=A0ABW5BLG1_9PROT